jgi:hypothetical protein
VQVGRVLAWQAPPRRFFAGWCGGMNVQDLLVLAFVLAFNLWYFIYYYTYYGKQLDAGGWRGCRQACCTTCLHCVDAAADPL